jgi:hypothetical protein
MRTKNRISRKKYDKFKERLKLNRLFQYSNVSNVSNVSAVSNVSNVSNVSKNKNKYDNGIEIIPFPDVLNVVPHTPTTMTQETNNIISGGVFTASIRNSNSNKTNTKRTKNMQMADVKRWQDNPLENPLTKKRIKEEDISFTDINTEYGRLYLKAFSAVWDTLNIDILEKHTDKMGEDIKYIKSQLPDLHCYKVNDNYEDNFDYLFYDSYEYILQTKIDGAFENFIHSTLTSLPFYLKYVHMYKIMATKYEQLIDKKIKYSVIRHKEKVREYIIKVINEFLYEFVKYNMNEMKKIVLWHNYLNNDVLYEVANKLRNMQDLQKIYNDFTFEISSDNLIRIFDIIEDDIIEISKHTQIDINLEQYSKEIEKIDIGKFITYTSSNLIQIANFNISDDNTNKKYTYLENNDFELEEPLKPFLKEPREQPPYPKIKDIQKSFAISGQKLTEIDKREIQDIFETKKKRWIEIKKERDNYKNALHEYESKMKDYETKKESYDKKLATIKQKSVSPLQNGDNSFRVPPNKNKTMTELLQNLVGNSKDKCNLDDDGALSTPFTTDFSPLEEYPLYKLQLVVKIHTRNRQNKIIRTDCGNPIDLYNYIISYYNENKIPINPFTKKQMTKENINAIMKMLPFATKNAHIERPQLIKEKFDNELFISFSQKDGYYTAFLLRSFGRVPNTDDESSQGIDIPIYQICSFPSDIGNDDSIDRTSTGMAYLLDTLFSERKLLHTYMSPYAIVRPDGWSVIKIASRLLQFKTPNDWEANRNRQEIENLFFDLYDELSRI